jgi:hypothetical protein
MKTTKKNALPNTRMFRTIRAMRMKVTTALIGIAVVVTTATSFVSTAHAEEETMPPLLTPLTSTTFTDNINSGPNDSIVPPDFGNNSFAQQFSPGVTAVPEPSTLALGALGAVALAATSLRRRSR